MLIPPRSRLARAAAFPALLLLLLGLVVLGASACDRDDLNDGDGIARVPEEPVKPPPGPECPPPSPTGYPVKINEVVFRNEASLLDEDGNPPTSWVELINTSDTKLNVGGVALSNEFGFPEKWVIPCIRESDIPAGGFLIIYLDGDTADDKDLHASFTLDPAAEEVELLLNRGSDIFRFDSFELAPDVAVGRHPDGAAVKPRVLSAPTPRAANAEPGNPGGSVEGAFIRGDANASGTVNVTDLTLVQRVGLGLSPPPPCQDRADVNDDGRLDAADGAYLQSLLFSTGPNPPPPYPAEGTDPTADSLPCPR